MHQNVAKDEVNDVPNFHFKC